MVVERITEDDELQKVRHDPCKPVLSHSPSAQSPELLMPITISSSFQKRG